MMNLQNNKKIAIIGAGPSGMSQMIAFKKAQLQMNQEIPEIVCFEKQDRIGGQWNFTWRTGLDEYGFPLHNSMYSNLYTNGPKEFYEFPDFTFQQCFEQNFNSFPPREVIEYYLTERFKQYDCHSWIKFNTIIKNVEYDDTIQQFKVSSTNLKDKTDSIDIFDYVIVATGHFSIPNNPSFEGFQNFKGKIIHSHDFRNSLEFKDQNILIIGANHSAEDIAFMCYKYGSKKITISGKKIDAIKHYKWPEKISISPILLKMQGNNALFLDGTVLENVDAIIMCTGYQHYFPFIEQSLRLKTHNCLHPNNLYKGIFFLQNQKLIYLGMQDNVLFTFIMLEAQTLLSTNKILGTYKLPSELKGDDGLIEMKDDISKWIEREKQIQQSKDMFYFQKDYVTEIIQQAGGKQFNFDGCLEVFNEFVQNRENDIMSYRDQVFTSPLTGIQSIKSKIKWIDSFDLSIEEYMRNHQI